MSTFKKGVVVGGVLGVFFAWLNFSKKGRELREQVIGQATDIYLDIKEKAMASGAWETLTKNKYMLMVEEAVDKYAVQSGLTDKVRYMIVRLLALKWKTLERELREARRRQM